MFSSLGLFRGISCPEGESCSLPSCVFSHHVPALSVEDAQKRKQPSGVESKHERPTTPDGFAGKRRRLDSTSTVPTKVSTAEELSKRSTKPEQTAFLGTLPSHKNAQSSRHALDRMPPTPVSKDATDMLRTGRKRVSPPPLPDRKRARLSIEPLRREVPKERKETLNPRMITNDPAGHGTRLLYLKRLHQEMARLNQEVRESTDSETKALHLSDDELIKLALDEEEKMAKENPAVYANVIKLRMVAYKRMALGEWKKLRSAAKKALQEAPSTPGQPSRLVTGLQPTGEIAVLPRLLTNQEGLDKHGYVTKPPTESDIEAAQKGVRASDGWEQCDRCKTRFQVFPDRREDGALTSGGACMYHWGRPARPPRTAADAVKGHKEMAYSCCNDPIGSPGCTAAPTHVFKISEAKRLAAVMQFERTPINDRVGDATAVCFDCEMGYTVFGLELIRLSATSWPDGAPLIDVLVRPLGAILDLNSRFSGVFPEDFANALPYNMDDEHLASLGRDANGQAAKVPSQSQPLRVVSSPQAARSLLFSFLKPSTPLIGHALENDLNAIRIVHPSIIDTVTLFPHPRGFPMRYGLKYLTKRHLEKDIQMAGAAGHDSLEDARAAGELVRWKVGREWMRLKGEGWTLTDAKLLPPASKKAADMSEGDGSPQSALSGDPPGSNGTNKKRKRP